MAEINVQQKSSNAVWWVLGIIGVALLLWLLFGWNWGAETPVYDQGFGGAAQPSALAADMPTNVTELG